MGGMEAMASTPTLSAWRASSMLSAVLLQPTWAITVSLPLASLITASRTVLRSSIWQLLPLSPTGYGDSPYQSCSAFAGNPYFVDLETLEKEGLLTAADLKAESWGKDPLEVDYGTLYVSRFAVLRKAYAAWRSQCAGLHGCAYYYPDDYYAFTLANEDWLEDYALYMALKVANKMKNWVEWDAPYRRRDKAALAAFAAENEEEIGFWKFVQYKFSVQWQAVKAYANEKGVQILGDIPIYVSADSVDAWVGGKLFELDADGRFARRSWAGMTCGPSHGGSSLQCSSIGCCVHIMFFLCSSCSM